MAGINLSMGNNSVSLPLSQPASSGGGNSIMGLLSNLGKDLTNLQTNVNTAQNALTNGVNINLTPNVNLNNSTVNVPVSEAIKKMAPWLVLGFLVIAAIILAVKRGG